MGSAGTTGAIITGNELFVTTAGTAVITATIANGTDAGVNYSKSFYITATTTSIDDVETQNLKIYPNPVKAELKIEIGELKINRVEIIDFFGKAIYQFNELRNQINVSALPQGIYFVKLKTDKGTVKQKFVKE